MSKEEDYARQRRNTYGEAPHAARKAIPRRKQRQNQKQRRSVRAALARGDEESATRASVRTRTRNPFRKVADEPLGRVMLRRIVREFIKREISASTFRRKLKPLREKYPNFVREYRYICHGYSHVRFDEDMASVLAEFR